MAKIMFDNGVIQDVTIMNTRTIRPAEPFNGLTYEKMEYVINNNSNLCTPFCISARGSGKSLSQSLLIKNKIDSAFGLPFRYEKIIFNDPATIVIWADGTKTVAKCMEGETFDPEKGIAICFMKKAINDSKRYRSILHNECKKYEKQIRLESPFVFHILLPL